MRAHMRTSWDKPNLDCEPGKPQWLAEGNQQKCLIKVTQTATRAWLSDPVFPRVCLCVYAHVLYLFPLINTLLALPLSIFQTIIGRGHPRSVFLWPQQSRASALVCPGKRQLHPCLFGINWKGKEKHLTDIDTMYVVSRALHLCCEVCSAWAAVWFWGRFTMFLTDM